MSKLVIVKELGRTNVVTQEGIILTDVSSDKQIENGTLMLQTEMLGKTLTFASYKSGYCRILGVSDRIYQINKVIKQSVKYYYQGVSYSSEYKTRVLIPDALDRIEYISDFVDRRYRREVKKIADVSSVLTLPTEFENILTRNLLYNISEY
jgi:hypothetical protein